MTGWNVEDNNIIVIIILHSLLNIMIMIFFIGLLRQFHAPSLFRTISSQSVYKTL